MGAILLIHSQIRKKPLCLNMLDIHVDVMFVTCLTKLLSWMGGVEWVRVDVIAFVCLFYYYLPYAKVTRSFRL